MDPWVAHTRVAHCMLPHAHNPIHTHVLILLAPAATPGCRHDIQAQEKELSAAQAAEKEADEQLSGVRERLVQLRCVTGRLLPALT